MYMGSFVYALIRIKSVDAFADDERSINVVSLYCPNVNDVLGYLTH